MNPSSRRSRWRTDKSLCVTYAPLANKNLQYLTKKNLPQKLKEKDWAD
jgi:hypothetical protein